MARRSENKIAAAKEGRTRLRGCQKKLCIGFSGSHRERQSFSPSSGLSHTSRAAPHQVQSARTHLMDRAKRVCAITCAIRFVRGPAGWKRGRKDVPGIDHELKEPCCCGRSFDAALEGVHAIGCAAAQGCDNFCLGRRGGGWEEANSHRVHLPTSVESAIWLLPCILLKSDRAGKFGLASGQMVSGASMQNKHPRKLSSPAYSLKAIATT
jgi:hypothetical protein